MPMGRHRQTGSGHAKNWNSSDFNNQIQLNVSINPIFMIIWLLYMS